MYEGVDGTQLVDNILNTAMNFMISDKTRNLFEYLSNYKYFMKDSEP
jgi:hypothetical protein